MTTFECYAGPLDGRRMTYAGKSFKLALGPGQVAPSAGQGTYVLTRTDTRGTIYLFAGALPPGRELPL